MSIETLAKQGRDRIHTGLAGIDVNKLRQMRNNSLRECFARFNEMHYRMEFVATIHGKQFVNDAAARTVNATWYALESLEGNTIWIVNSCNVEQDYSQLAEAVRSKVSRIICIGDSTSLRNSLGSAAKSIEEVQNMREAVTSALYGTLENATVIYSPACESASMEQEGELFRFEVNEL